MPNKLLSFFKAVLYRRDNIYEEERLCEDRQGVKDTLGATPTLRIPGIRTRRWLEESIFLAD